MYATHTMSPFEFSEYRAYLNAVCEEKAGVRGLRAALAREAGCQASYLSQVLKTRAHLSEDQILGIATHIELSATEVDYLLILLRHEKAATPKLKEYLHLRALSAIEEHKKLKYKIDNKGSINDNEAIAVYVSSWIPSAVHLLTDCPEYQNLELIAQRLKLPPEKVKETLQYLEQSGLVERNGNRWVYKRGFKQIMIDSPFQPALQKARRDLAGRSILIRPPGSIHFSSIFGSDDKSMIKLRELFANLIEKSHKVIESSETKNLSCMCLDLFEIV